MQELPLTEGGRQCPQAIRALTGAIHGKLKYSAGINSLTFFPQPLRVYSTVLCLTQSGYLDTEHVWNGCSGYSGYLWSLPHRVACQHIVRLSPVFPHPFAEFTNSQFIAFMV